MITCKGLCDSLLTYDRYEGDYKYCAICAIHIEVHGKLRCPCCHAVMRSKTRKNTFSVNNKRYAKPYVRY